MFGIGPLRIIIGGDSKGFDRALAGVQARVAGFSRSIRTVVAGLGIAAAVAGVVALTKESYKTIDAQSELAYRIGGTISAVQTLTAVGDKAGVNFEQLSKAAGLMNMRLAEAARTGAGPAYEALRRVGLSAKDLIKLDVDERLAVIADRFKALGLTAGQQAEVLRSFGIRGQEMINLLEGGGDTIRQTRKDLEAYGVALSAVDGHQVELANDALKDAKLALTGIANQVSVALAPLIGTLANDFAAAGKASGGFRDQVQDAVGTAVRVFGLLNREIYYIRVGWDDAVAEIIQGVNLISTVANKLTFFLDPFLEKIPMVGTAYGQLREKLGKPPSIEEWTKWWDQIKQGWADAAGKVAESQKKMLGRSGPEQDALTSEQRDSLNKRFVALQRSLANEAAALDFWKAEELLKLKEFEDKRIGTDAQHHAMQLAIWGKYHQDRNNLIWSKLEEGVATEQEILARKHEQQLQALAAFEAARATIEGRGGELRGKLAERQALDIIRLQAKQYAGLAGIVDTAMGHISQIIGKEGGAAFEIMKGISMATAVVKGFEAVVSAWATGNATGIPGMGAVMAGITAAGVAAQIAGIARTKPGGGGGTVTAPSGGGASAAAAAPTGGAAAGPGATLTVQGIDPSSLFSGEMVRALSQRLLAFQRDGGQVVLA